MTRIFLRLFIQGVKDLALNPWPQATAFCAITLASFLSGLFLMTLATLNHELGVSRGEIAFQVFWHPGTDMEEIAGQWQDFTHLPGLKSVRTFTPEQALGELGTRLGRSAGTLEQGFPFLAEQSPLPATALLAFLPDNGDPERRIQEISGVLESLPGVARVSTTPLSDELGSAWRKVSRYVMWPSIALLNLVLGLVVGNTVRLAQLAKAHEVEILQLAGAFNWYIRTPLIITGVLTGLGGGLLALGLLRLIHLQIADVLNFPPLLMRIQFLGWPAIAALLLVPALTAACASWLAVRGR